MVEQPDEVPEDVVPQGDSDILHKPADTPGVFQVYAAGEATVVGFAGQAVPNDFWIGAYKDELARIVREYNSKELAFDLGGVTAIPSGMLGLLSSLKDLNVTISLYNPSLELREIIELTKLSEVVEIRELELEE